MRSILTILIIFCVSIFSFSQENQNIETAKLETGSYQVYKTIEKGYKKYIFQQAKKNWPVEFFKSDNACSKILVKRVGIVEEFYKADLPAFPAYYFGGNAEINVTVINKKIYYYSWTESNGSSIKYILSMSKPTLFNTEKENLDSYRRSIKSKQTGSRDERKKDNAAIAAKSAEENTLKGKSIKSIKVKLVDPNVSLGMFSIVGIGMEVTLTNGKVLKTKNLGGKTPYSDFESNAVGGNYTGGNFKIENDTRKIIGDKITLKVWSKFNTAVKGNLSQPLNYKNDMYYHYQGNGGAHGRGGVHGKSEYGGHGKDGKNINITAVKMTINGQNVTKITVMDANSYKVLSEGKIHINNTVTLNCKGGNGGNGADGHFNGDDGSNGGDGGNGGNVSITGTGRTQLKIIIQNQGGNAGTGGKGKESYNRSGISGSRGRNGTSNK